MVCKTVLGHRRDHRRRNIFFTNLKICHSTEGKKLLSKPVFRGIC